MTSQAELNAGNERSALQLKLEPRLETFKETFAWLTRDVLSRSIHAQPAAGLFHRWWARARTSLFWMVVIAFALRLAFILIAHTYKFKPDQNDFSFGYEMGRIGRAIATGQGFANPFDGQTGPTAWEPPLYPYLIAGVFKLTGVYTSASALILLTLNSFFSALTCIPIFLIARRCFSERVAVWTAWAWALLPTVMYWSTRWVWETSLAALLLALIFWLTLKLEELEGLQPWIAFGLLWGLAALTSESSSSSVRILGRNFAWVMALVRTAHGWLIFTRRRTGWKCAATSRWESLHMWRSGSVRRWSSSGPTTAASPGSASSVSFTTGLAGPDHPEWPESSIILCFSHPRYWRSGV